MQEKKKFHRPPANVVYEIDGASYGLDDGLVEAIKNHIRRRLESKTLEIPRLPQVADRILQLSRNPNTTIDDIVQVMTTDPVLATRILVIANSAAYAGGDRVEGLKPALMRLGSRVVKDMVFAESVHMNFSARSCRSLLEQSWNSRSGRPSPARPCRRRPASNETVRPLGLLHDTGNPVLVSAVSDTSGRTRGSLLARRSWRSSCPSSMRRSGPRCWVSGACPRPSSARPARTTATREAPEPRPLTASSTRAISSLSISTSGTSSETSSSRSSTSSPIWSSPTSQMSPILDPVTRETEGVMAGSRCRALGAGRVDVVPGEPRDLR